MRPRPEDDPAYVPPDATAHLLDDGLDKPRFQTSRLDSGPGSGLTRLDMNPIKDSMALAAQKYV